MWPDGGWSRGEGGSWQERRESEPELFIKLHHPPPLLATQTKQGWMVRDAREDLGGEMIQ